MSEHFVKRSVDAQADTHEFVPKAREHFNALRKKAKYHSSVPFRNDNAQTLARTNPLASTLNTDLQRVVSLDWPNEWSCKLLLRRGSSEAHILLGPPVVQ